MSRKIFPFPPSPFAPLYSIWWQVWPHFCYFLAFTQCKKKLRSLIFFAGILLRQHVLHESLPKDSDAFLQKWVMNNNKQVATLNLCSDTEMQTSGDLKTGGSLFFSSFYGGTRLLCHLGFVSLQVNYPFGNLTERHKVLYLCESEAVCAGIARFQSSFRKHTQRLWPCLGIRCSYNLMT